MTLPVVAQRTTPGFAFSIMQRALLDCIAERRFGKPEIDQVIAFFGNECAYCGGSVQRWDHLVPVRRGGDTVLGNIVPACSKCDDSKGGMPFNEWAMSRAPSSPLTRGVCDIDKRVARIHEYVTDCDYRPQEPNDRLSVEELQQFDVIRDDLGRLRIDIDNFIVLYRKRTGLV